jgi:hypothetical protein
MPKIDHDPGETPTPQEEFLSGFRRNRKGNLWRLFEGRTLTVFRRRGGFACCVSSEEEGTDFSPETFDTEEEALADLADLYAGW